MPENEEFLASSVVLIRRAARNLGSVVAAEFLSHGAPVAITDSQFSAEARERIERLNAGQRFPRF